MKINTTTKINFNLCIWLILGASIFLGNSLTAQAGTIDIRMTNPQQNQGKYCVQMEARSQSLPLRVGNSTIKFHYSTPAVRNPKAAPINLAPQPCPDSGDANLYTGSFTQIEDDVLGDGIYNLILTEAFTACPLLTNEWMTIANICFDVIDPNKHINLIFNKQQSIIRTDANSVSKHNLGIFTGIQQLAGAVCNDALQNGAETAIDCGGVCTFCENGDTDVPVDEDTNDEADVDITPDTDVDGDVDVPVDEDTNDEADVDITPDTDGDGDTDVPIDEDTNDEADIDVVPDEAGDDDEMPTYCNARGKNTKYEWIESFMLGSIANVSENSDGYGAYTNMTATLDREQSHSFELRPGFKSKKYFETWCIFVDWNQDGDFIDQDELVYDERSDSALIGDLVVPDHAKQGATRMRVVMAYDRKRIKPCRDIKWGEIEDYRIDVVGEPLPNFVRVCSPPTANTDYEWIETIQIDNDNYPSGDNNGYGDFMSTLIQMKLGETYEIMLKTGYAKPTQKYKQYWRIFIDYNQDKDFDDEGEIAFDSQMPVSEKAMGQLAVPADALTGKTTMRVMMKFSKNPPQPCGQGSKWGEVEDYTIEFTE